MRAAGRPRAGLRAWSVAGAVLVVLAGVAASWLAIDRRPPDWDHAHHLERGLHCARELAAGRLVGALGEASFYPPLVFCLAGMAGAVWPSDQAAGQAVILAFLALALAAVCALGLGLGGERAGAVAAMVLGTSPIVVLLSVRFQVDVPLAALVAAALVALHRCDGFARRGWSLAAGAAVGLGLLTKPTFPVYVLVPLAAVAWRARGRRAASSAGLALTLGGLLALPWYGPRLVGLPAQLIARSTGQAVKEGDPAALSLAGLAWYPLHLASAFGLLAGVLACLGLLTAIRRRQWFPLLALLGPLPILLLARNKDLRYLLPLLPALAVVAGLGVAGLGPRLGMLACAAVALLGAVQISATAFGVPGETRLSGLSALTALASPPAPDPWPHRAILALLVREGLSPGATVSVVPNHSLFSIANFRYYALRDGLRIGFVRAWDESPLGVEAMILKSGPVGPSWTAARIRRVADRLAADADLARVFPVVGEFPLPDGSTAAVRVRRVPPVQDLPLDRLAAGVEAGLRARAGEVAAEIEGLAVRLAWDGGLSQGRLSRIEIAAAGALAGDLRRPGAALLRVRDVRIAVEGALVNPWSARAGRFEPLDADRLVIERGEIRLEDLAGFVRRQRRFEDATVGVDAGSLHVVLPRRGPDLEAWVRPVAAADRPFTLADARVAVGGVPIPSLLVSWVLRHYDPSARLAARLPVPVRVRPVRITREAITIGAEGN